MKKYIIKTSLTLLSIILIIAVSMIPTFAANYVQEGDWKYEVVGNHSEYYIASYLGTDGRVYIPALYQLKRVTKINDNAFLNNKTVTYVDFPATVTSIGMNAFYGCTSLKSLVIPSEITHIGNNAFYGCTSMIQVTVESNPKITSIPRNCFSGCVNLITVVLTQGIESIESYAFNGCLNLSSVIIPPSVETIADDAFERCDKLIIKGWDGTYAQQYAEEKGIEFFSYGEYIAPTTPPVTETTTPATSAPTEPTVPEVTTPDETTAPTDPTEAVTLPTETTSSETTEPASSEDVEPESSQRPTSNTKTYLIGDGDLDGKITVKDATIIQKFIASFIRFDRIQLFLSNCDGVGDINIKDVTQIQKYCAGFLNILFVGTEVEI